MGACWKPNATMAAAGSAGDIRIEPKSGQTRRLHSDIIASLATATVEFSRAVSAGVQRRHQPQQKLMKRSIR
jgi:hypothetical protein